MSVKRTPVEVDHGKKVGAEFRRLRKIAPEADLQLVIEAAALKAIGMDASKPLELIAESMSASLFQELQGDDEGDG